MNAAIVFHEFQGGKGDFFQVLHGLEPQRRQSVCQRSLRLVQRHILAGTQCPLFVMSQERLVAPRIQIVLACRVLISILALRRNQKELQAVQATFARLALYQGLTLVEEHGLRRLLSDVCAAQAGKNRMRHDDLSHSLAILGHFSRTVACDKARLACHVQTFAKSAMRHAWLRGVDWSLPDNHGLTAAIFELGKKPCVS